MYLKHLFASSALVLAAVAAVPTQAEIVLTFDELDGSVNESPLDFYDGGFGSAGTGPGPDYGITFSSNSITGCEITAPCGNTNSDQLPSSPNLLFFLSGGSSIMNVAGGFDTGFSFYYAAPVFEGVVNVYSGLDGTGTLLASLNLPLTTTGGDCAATYCPFTAVGVAFDGIAMSVSFGGTDDYIGFDNITLGSVVPGGPSVPEPATWAMMIGGFGLAGGALRRRQKVSIRYA